MQVGDKLLSENCTQECECKGPDNLVCGEVACHENAECVPDAGVRRCICKSGHAGNGYQCSGKILKLPNWFVITNGF